VAGGCGTGARVSEHDDPVTAIVRIARGALYGVVGNQPAKNNRTDASSAENLIEWGARERAHGVLGDHKLAGSRGYSRVERGARGAFDQQTLVAHEAHHRRVRIRFGVSRRKRYAHMDYEDTRAPCGVQSLRAPLDRCIHPAKRIRVGGRERRARDDRCLEIVQKQGARSRRRIHRFRNSATIGFTRSGR